MRNKVHIVAPTALCYSMIKLSTIISHRWCREKHKNQRFGINGKTNAKPCSKHRRCDITDKQLMFKFILIFIVGL